MTAPLDAILPVLALASGASTVLPHGLIGKPTRVMPDRATPIAVTLVTATHVTFTNLGGGTESAYFWAKRDHSIQQDGTVELFWQGSAGFSSFALANPQWNDLLGPLVSAAGRGLNPPLFVGLANDGTVVPGKALNFNGTDAVAAVADFGDFSLSHTISFWLNTSYAAVPARNILVKASTLTIDLSNGVLRYQPAGQPRQNVPGFLLGTKNHVVLVTTKVAAAVTLIEGYVNGVQTLNVTVPSALAADNANAFAVMATNLSGVLDELRFYQAALTSAQVAELYNAGAGTENEPTGAPTLLAGYHCNDGAGNTAVNYEGTAARDMALTNVTWVAGLVGAAGTPGVFGPSFGPGEMHDQIFLIQMNHGWKIDSDYDIHIHWTAPVLDGGATKVVFGVELQTCNMHAAWPATTTVYTVEVLPNATPANTHQLANLVDLPGAGKTLSHLVRARIFRLGTGVDNFPLPIIIDTVDAHYQMDTLGSRQEMAK